MKEVTLTLGSQTFRLRVKEEHEPLFLQAATLVEDKLNRLQQLGMLSTQRSALLAALQLAFELLRTDGAVGAVPAELEERLDGLIELVESSLATNWEGEEQDD